MSIKAMKLALDALELEDMACRYEKDPTPKHIAKAITALRQAIEQAEQQESVAWVSPSWLHPETRTWASESFAHKPIAGWIPLYTR